MTDEHAELIPYLCVKDATAAMEFYKKAFGAKELFRLEGEGGTIGHATMQILGATFYLSDEWPEGNVYSPQTLGGSPVALHLHVPDADSIFDRAVAAGATALRPVADQPYGDRSGVLADPFEHRWFIASTIEEVSTAELEKRMPDYKVTTRDDA
jgi:PhnB protein